MSGETEKPGRAGHAFMDSVSGSSALHGTVRKVKTFAPSVRAAVEPTNQATESLIAAFRNSEKFKAEEILKEHFRKLALRFAELRPISEKFAQLCRFETKPPIQLAQWEPRSLTPRMGPAFRAPAFLSSITAINEQIGENLRTAMRGQQPSQNSMTRDVTEPLIAEHATQRPHDTAQALEPAEAYQRGENETRHVGASAIRTRSGAREPNGAKKTSREALLARAEEYLKNRRGVFLGVRPLARALRCPVSSLANAINSSSYLRARKAEYLDRKKSGRCVPLNDIVLDQHAQETEADPSETLNALIADQADDMEADDQMSRRQLRSPRRS